MYTTPILFMVFNKPEETLKSFEAIRAIRPAYLFIAADGPRSHKEGEAAQCSATRKAIMQSIDWSCEVHTLFREQNLGCKDAIRSAISWFFRHVDKGVILEDDCWASPEFFFFCEDLLIRYADDPRIGAISGNSFLPEAPDNFSYYFFNIPQIWGWATWKRAWDLYDPCMKSWPLMRGAGFLEKNFGNLQDVQYWTYIFDQVFLGKIDTWDYQWTYTLLANALLSINPSANLVTNIGLGSANATHTADAASQRLCIPHQPLDFPLRHPLSISVDNSVADFLYRFCFRG